MSFRKLAGSMAAVALLSAGVAAEEAATVESLIKQGFAIVGTTAPASGGGAVFLQKKEQVFFCYITETPSSPAVTTRYCKPVQ